MANRFGKWPHEVIALDPAELALASACVEAADAETASRVARAKGIKAMVFPVVSMRV